MFLNNYLRSEFNFFDVHDLGENDKNMSRHLKSKGAGWEALRENMLMVNAKPDCLLLSLGWI